ncbi:hypothetical protein H9X85_05960 [Anaerotignum lactatifermentans]|uniref:Copper amine oxidase-like N-terminal domain-containing protein n=1 Tax=Anaerotignum lactatifermentans TaxID=160404 RepID=A0ABS2G9Z6_9FIRM|nr:stalk domain-containing protein [Anaerotignum lactatifermentans]MBM6829005.1 hypothetical protein [Anaerotignum lactatifermentans]MBM6877388.1 hypothetical protein [Anaerotignum lactatifermentans]MBM6950758.1 hypothetical protein [Anaerotignum lactatifermentans]
MNRHVFHHKIFQRIGGLFLTLALLASLTPAAVQAHPPITVYVDGKEVVFDQAPVIQNDRTLVPMRKIFEAMDATVLWEESAQTITSQRGSDVVLMIIGQNQVYKNGEVVYTMDVPAQIMNDRTMVPIRAVAMAFDADVAWDGVNYVINISTSGSAQTTGGNYRQEIKADDGTTVMTIELTYTPLTQNSSVANTINETIYTQLQAEGSGAMMQYAEAAKAAYALAQRNSEYFSPWYYRQTNTVSTEDNRYASILQETLFFAGTVEQTLTATTYSMITGKELGLTDIVPDDPDDLEESIRQGFLALIAQKETAFYSDAESRLNKNIDDTGFYLTKDGITFFLNPGILANRDAGVIGFHVIYSY